MTSIIVGYDYIINNLSDHRVKEWLLMKDPWCAIGLALAYLYAVYIYLPKHMAHRKAYNFKVFLSVYNIAQVLVNAFLVYGVLTSGWTTHYKMNCQLVDFSENEMAVRMAKMTWCAFMIKLIDLVETFIFVLRKKDNQVTTLHVFHHVSTFLLAWILTKYAAGGMYTLPIILNSTVHVLMYSYYYLATLGPQVREKLKFFKPTLTLIQIIQLIAIIWQQCLSFRCKGSLYPLSIISGTIISVDLILFLNFYVKNYIKKTK